MFDRGYHVEVHIPAYQMLLCLWKGPLDSLLRRGARKKESCGLSLANNLFEGKCPLIPETCWALGHTTEITYSSYYSSPPIHCTHWNFNENISKNKLARIPATSVDVSKFPPWCYERRLCFLKMSRACMRGLGHALCDCIPVPSAGIGLVVEEKQRHILCRIKEVEWKIYAQIYELKELCQRHDAQESLFMYIFVLLGFIVSLGLPIENTLELINNRWKRDRIKSKSVNKLWIKAQST